MAPALTACSTSSCSPDADRISTRTVGSSRTSSAVTSTPLGAGICRSSTTTCGRVAFARFSASRPGRRGGDDLEPGLGEVPGHAVAPHRVVVDDHHLQRHLRVSSHRHRSSQRDPWVTAPPPAAQRQRQWCSEGYGGSAGRRYRPRRCTSGSPGSPRWISSTTPSTRLRPAHLARPVDPEGRPGGHPLQERAPRRLLPAAQAEDPTGRGRDPGEGVGQVAVLARTAAGPRPGRSPRERRRRRSRGRPVPARAPGHRVPPSATRR